MHEYYYCRVIHYMHVYLLIKEWAKIEMEMGWENMCACEHECNHMFLRAQTSKCPGYVKNEIKCAWLCFSRASICKCFPRANRCKFAYKRLCRIEMEMRWGNMCACEHECNRILIFARAKRFKCLGYIKQEILWSTFAFVSASQHMQMIWVDVVKLMWGANNDSFLRVWSTLCATQQMSHKKDSKKTKREEWILGFDASNLHTRFRGRFASFPAACWAICGKENALRLPMRLPAVAAADAGVVRGRGENETSQNRFAPSTWLSGPTQ